MNLMLDLETYATTMDACVMTIGAVVFDKSGKEIDCFYRRIDGESCDRLGLTRDQKTINFWAQQSGPSKFELETTINRMDIADVIREFTQFWYDNKCEFLWCNGANFDEPILSTIYHKLGVEKPWRFFNVRCVRTLYSIAGFRSSDFGPVGHHALEDCRKQVRGVVSCWKIISVQV